MSPKLDLDDGSQELVQDSVHETARYSRCGSLRSGEKFEELNMWKMKMGIRLCLSLKMKMTRSVTSEMNACQIRKCQS